MKISLSATNPCHVWDMARALAARGELGRYYSGYPKWRLRGAEGVPLATHPARTLAVYGLRKFLPENLRPKDRTLFRWQDAAFDRWAARALEPCDFIHCLPGQARETFRRAQELGIATVLSHATGPVRALEKAVAPEYERAGLDFARETQFDASYFAREEEEYALADYHWAASSVVAERLADAGVAENKIWTVPYGVDREVFGFEDVRRNDSDDSKEFRLAFAGQLSLRKGIRFLLAALEEIGDAEIAVDFFGHPMAETGGDLDAYTGPANLAFHGPVPQPELARAFRRADALVLPSLEEGFGLVVIQALACGLPVLVSDAVGAKDAVRPGENGEIFAAADAGALAEAIRKARAARYDRAAIAAAAPTWEDAAARLGACSAAALADSQSGSKNPVAAG